MLRHSAVPFPLMDADEPIRLNPNLWDSCEIVFRLEGSTDADENDGLPADPTY